MTTTQALQNLQDEFRKLMDQAKSSQSSLQHLRNAKKEADISKRRHEMLASLKTMHDATAKLEEQMKTNQEQLEEAVGHSDRQKEDKKDTADKGKGPGIIETRKLSPEQQEALYELKASRMGAMQSQNRALKQEALLVGRKRQLLEARYAVTQDYPGSHTLRAAHALEAKVRGANLKIKALEEELRKSQQTTLRYRELYEDSQRQSEADQQGAAAGGTKSAPGGGGPHRAKTTPTTAAPPATTATAAAPKPKPAPLKEQSFVGPNTNVNDVVRKNECLLEENDVQRHEIQRLKRDNAELISIAKTAAADRDSIFARLGTSESARQDLQKRYHRLKNENSQLSRSYTRQAAVWIDAKKQQQQLEAIQRWGEIYPVAPHGSKDRFFAHGQKENTSQPRQMYPVESYGGTSTA